MWTEQNNDMNRLVEKLANGRIPLAVLIRFRGRLLISRTQHVKTSGFGYVWRLFEKELGLHP